MKTIFDKNEVNTGRQIEADLAKAICIIGMVYVHSFEQITPNNLGDDAFRYILVTVLDCVFGASTFMFCMGMGIAYSNPTPRQLLRRGVGLLIVAYVLNIIRGVLPLLFTAWISGDSSCLSRIPRELVNLDILNFAGLALILFSLLMRLRKPYVAITVAALALSALGSYFRIMDMGSFMFNQVVGLFLGTAAKGQPTVAFFPLSNWFIFVAAGYLFAQLLRRCRDKVAFYWRIAPVMWLIVAVYLMTAIPLGIGMMGEDMNKFYDLTTPEAFICICASIGVFGSYYGLSHIVSERVLKPLTTLSRNINTVYCIHWVLLCWVWFPFRFGWGVSTMPEWFVLIFGTCLLLVSATLAQRYALWKKHKKEARIAAQTNAQ